MKTIKILSTTTLFLSLSSAALADSSPRSCSQYSHQQTKVIAESDKHNSLQANQPGKPILYNDVDRFLTDARSLVGKKVQVTGHIEPALGLSSCTLKGCPFPNDAKLGDQLLCNYCSFATRLASQQGSGGIMLRGVTCAAREVVVYQGKENWTPFFVVNSCDSGIKLEKTYTVTGVVKQWPREAEIANLSDLYIDEVTSIKLSK